jgi:ABC-type antimicrobial peptide transport system permease subunit
MFLKLKSGATFEQRDALTNGLRNFLKSDRIQLTDTAEIITATDTAITILNLFFNVVAMIVLILCFFTLLVSFTSNVNENAWEFGVLRSLGLNVRW